MTVTAQTAVGTIATEHPPATRVFARHGIDFCCRGGRALAEACAAKSVQPEQVLAEIEHEIADTTAEDVRWDREPLPALIRHILDHYHAPLKEELPRLEAMAAKVQRVHGDKVPSLAEVRDAMCALRSDLEQHMMKEERVLFPMILSGQGALAGGPVSVMEEEHDAAGELLRRLRRSTDDYRVPDGACTTWRALWAGLQALEESLHEHIHLENNILHRRALGAGARSLRDLSRLPQRPDGPR